MSSKILSRIGFDNDAENKDYKSILLMAPHGSGKGVCYVLPALLTFDESVIVHDIKMENYDLTSGYRSSLGHKIFHWNPLSENTHRYNPLDFISNNEKKVVDDIDKIAYILINEDVEFSTEAKKLFISLVLYLQSNPSKSKSFGEIAKMLDGDLKASLSKDLNKVHAYGRNYLSAFLKKDEAIQDVVIGVLSDYLAPYTNPLIDYATSKSDFDIADFKKNKTTLYIGLNPDDIDRLKPVMNLFYQHAIQRLADVARELGCGEKHLGVTLFIDEFSSQGKIAILPSVIAYLRGYKIKLFLIAADIDSIEKVYEECDTNIIMSNCAFKIVFAPNDYNTADVLSLICIDHKTQEGFYTPEELIAIPHDSQVLIIDHQDPLLFKKEYYYENEELKKRTEIKAV